MTIKSNQDELIDDLCAQAEASHRAGDLQSARQIYEAVLQLDPESARAREGLALASLTDNNWSLMERAGSHDALVARAREALASGLVDQAAQLAAELQQRAPADARVTALQHEIAAVRAIAPRIEQLLTQAREALTAQRAGEAATFCRQALELDPAHRDAELLLEQAERAAPAAPAFSNDLSLELDLDLAMPGLTPPVPPRAGLDPNATVRTTLPISVALGATSPPPTAAPVAAPAKPPRPDANVWDAGEFARDLADITDRPSKPKHDDGMDDLLDAARDLDQPTEVPEDRQTLQPTGPAARAEGEAALLVARAREEFESGRHEDARQLASQALALCEHATGAQDILDDVRAVSDRAAREADNLINQAIQDIENKRPDLAVPLLKQALMLAPGHAEALDYIERAERECESLNLLRQGASDTYGETHAPEDVSAIPLQEGGYRHATSVAPESPHAGSMHAGPPPAPPAVAAPVAGSATLAPTGAPPPPPAAPAVAPGPRMGGAPPAPPPRPAPSTTRATSASKFKLPPALAGGASKIVTWVVLVVVAAGLGVGRRVVSGFIGGLFSGSSSSNTASEPVKRPVKKAPATAGGTAAPAAAAAAAPAPTYTKDDVPALVQQAQAKLAGGDEAGAVAQLTLARQLDPDSFDAVERLEKARAALRARQDAEGRIKEARARYAQEDFEEALRIMYRIPQAYHPAGLNAWIANGWYNVGVQRLQTGDLREAIEFFGNCLEVRPNDEGASRNRDLARRYLGRATDDAYSIYVKGLALRPMDAR